MILLGRRGTFLPSSIELFTNLMKWKYGVALQEQARFVGSTPTRPTIILLLITDMYIVKFSQSWESVYYVDNY